MKSITTDDFLKELVLKTEKSMKLVENIINVLKDKPKFIASVLKNPQEIQQVITTLCKICLSPNWL